MLLLMYHLLNVINSYYYGVVVLDVLVLELVELDELVLVDVVEVVVDVDVLVEVDVVVANWSANSFQVAVTPEVAV